MKTSFFQMVREAFLQVLNEGFCKLYLQIKYVGVDQDVRFHYYVKSKGEKNITKIKSSGYIIGSGLKSNYFKDCQLAMEFIAKNKKMKYEDLISLVKLYNENCIN